MGQRQAGVALCCAIGVLRENLAEERFDLRGLEIWPSLAAELGEVWIGCAVASQPLEREFHLGATVFGEGRGAEGLKCCRLAWYEIGEGEEFLGVFGTEGELLVGKQPSFWAVFLSGASDRE